MRSVSRGRRNPFVGPLSQALWEKAHSMPSAYHDTFDYCIYDRLYERLGAEQPRGGVVYKGTMKLLSYDSRIAQDTQILCLPLYHFHAF